MLPTPPPSPPPTAGSCNPVASVGDLLGGIYLLTDVLGVGAYGTVFKARNVENGRDYAVKALNRVGLDQRQRTFLEREIRLHQYASDHPHVVSMEHILESPDCIFVVLEYCPEGDLFSRITEDGDYTGRDHKARAVFLQILDAVQHCHLKGVYHRDLKPENILVKDNGWNVKLADFGLATQERITSDFGCGSTFYMSPECQQSNPKPFACYASESNDVWSLGVILVNLVCGRNPWKRAALDDSTFRAFMKDRSFLQSILPISSGLNAILQRIFEINPRRRVKLNELRHLIQSCPQLSQESEDTSLPPSPPYSPEEKPVETFRGNVLEPVPQLDPLPVQQFPPLPSPTHFGRPQANNFTPFHPHTPPGSVRSSPQHPPYTHHAKPVMVSNYGPLAGSANYLQSFPWANFVPSPICWRSVMVA